MHEIRRAARHDRDLSGNAYRLLEDVIDLSIKTGTCHAGDDHFAEAFGVEKRTIRRWINEIKSAGYIVIEGSTNLRMIRPQVPDHLRTTCVLSCAELRTDPGHNLGQVGVLSGERLRTDSGRNLGQSRDDTLEIYNPERERGARAHEGRELDVREHPAVEAYRSITGSGIMADQFAAKIAASVGEEASRLEAWRGHVLVWFETPRWNHRQVPRMIEAFEEQYGARQTERREETDEDRQRAAAERREMAERELALLEGDD